MFLPSLLLDFLKKIYVYVISGENLIFSMKNPTTLSNSVPHWISKYISEFLEGRDLEFMLTVLTPITAEHTAYSICFWVDEYINWKACMGKTV